MWNALTPRPSNLVNVPLRSLQEPAFYPNLHNGSQERQPMTFLGSKSLIGITVYATQPQNHCYNSTKLGLVRAENVLFVGSDGDAEPIP